MFLANSHQLSEAMGLFHRQVRFFFLRNSGDPGSLQMMLRHATPEVVKTYLALAKANLEKNHKIASPVDHGWL
jgi:hypothetical protein